MAHNGWKPVSRQNPCPICDKPDNCSMSDDGSAVWCGRVSEGSTRQNDGGQSLHILREKDDRDWRPPVYVAPQALQAPPRDWGKFADETFTHPDASCKREELAAVLGVERESLDRLRVGWDTPKRQKPRWTMPERDATGSVIGIGTRYEDGAKKAVSGSKRGLIFDPGSWETSTEPILLVEGPSDTAAALSMGLCAIGRPSNNGGAELLAELLRAVPFDRRIIVLAENDRKPHDELSDAIKAQHSQGCEGCSRCWPGRQGAIDTAEKLYRKLCRGIEWCFPPNAAKDVREWLNAIRKEFAAECRLAI